MSAGALGCDAALGPGASLQRGRCRSTGGTDDCAETSALWRYFYGHQMATEPRAASLGLQEDGGGILKFPPVSHGSKLRVYNKSSHR